MTTQENTILEMLGKLNDKFDTKFESLSAENNIFNHKLDAISQENKAILADNKRFNIRFDEYQKATQWVVQLAFSLISFATITVIITSVLR